LIALGLDAAGRDRLSSLAFEMELSETIRSLPAVDIDELAAVYRRSRVLFHPACEPPWGGPVRNALACGLPVVSIDDDLINSLVGQAAYLVQADDTRLLGAALLTVLVEEEVAENLKGAAQQRAAGWSLPDYAQALAGVYQSILFSFQ
jgi:glycosyltransferase involved in cell wall biosynthesis